MGINADLKNQQLTCLPITLRIKSSLVISVSKAIHDGAPATPLFSACHHPVLSVLSTLCKFLFPRRCFPQLFAWLVAIHLSDLRGKNLSFNILELLLTLQKKKNLSNSPSCLCLHCYFFGPGLEILWSRLQSCVYSLSSNLFLSSPFYMLLPDNFLKNSHNVLCFLRNLQYFPTADEIKSEHVILAFKAVYGLPPPPLS